MRRSPWPILLMAAGIILGSPVAPETWSQERGGATDRVAQATFREYARWKKVNDPPVLSASHSDSWVVTFLNPRAEPAGLAGTFPFPEGAILAKESFEDTKGKPGARGPLYIMEKRGRGYDPPNGDWHYAVVNPDGTIGMSGSGRAEDQTSVCAECHAAARVNDYVFGRGTVMKVAPVKVPGSAPEPPRRR